MALFQVFDIAGSGMSAQSLRMNITASNIANAETVASSPDQAYKARQPVFSALLQGAGTRRDTDLAVQMVGVVESHAPNRKRYAPGHPLADKDGYIYESNVDLVEEMTNMISASRTYQTNVEVLNTSKEMLLATLRLGQ